jgi:ribosomal-protein-alanine N-acetyltransferase
MCFAVVPHGGATAIGIIQVRQVERGFRTAEWGFALGQPYWGTGLFAEAAELVLAFAFERVGVRRIEARAAVVNGRGSGALRKLGACREGTLHGSFSCGGERLDQGLWSILDKDWRRTKASRGCRAPSDGKALTMRH